MNNWSLIDWTIFVLIIVGLIGIILALIWTKLIKKNPWIHCNKTIFTINSIIDEIKKTNLVISNNQHSIIKNPFLSLLEKKSSCFFNLNNILISKNNIYFITYELSNKAKKISLENGKVILRDKKNKKYFLPIEIESVILNTRYIEEYLDQKITIIVPCYNDQISSNIKGWKNTYFASRKKLSNLINEQELNSKQNSIFVQDYHKLLSKINYKRKLKLPFISTKQKDNIWEK